MPYTPPTRSPSASPGSSRSSSFSSSQDARTHSTLNLFATPNSPRSTHYLNKHRRSSSVSHLPTMGSFTTSTPHQPQPRLPRSYSAPSIKDPRAGESLHRSPPPTDTGATIPPGAIMSPPESLQNSSDEEEGSTRRGRDLGKLEHELVEAVMMIPQQRAPSPDRSLPFPEAAIPVIVDDNSPLERKPSHQRTRSESALHSGGSSRSGNMSDVEDDAYRIAPPMVRKKSGEVVKSSLKSPGRSRPVSVPSTPTFPSKNVHFDSRIEHVRHFLHSERPSAVSAGSSPVADAYDGESEYPFGHDAGRVEWEIEVPNFPKDLEARKSLPVRLEKVYLSTDGNNLIGTVAVANLAFQKLVTARFTFDYWQTVSDVTAEWTNDVRRKDQEDGVDRFVFKIKLTEQANLEKKTMFLCIRYRSAGQEFWDNNGGFNFQVDFKVKQRVPTSRVVGARVPSTLPRSKPSSISPHSSSRPRSMPEMKDFNFMDQAFLSSIGDIGIRTKPAKPIIPKREDDDDDEEEAALPARRTNPPGNAFSTRYDLSAAIKAATSVQKEHGHRRSASEGSSTGSYFDFTPTESKPRYTGALESTTPMDSPSISGAGHPDVLRPNMFFSADKPSIESPSYRELLDNYCFASHKTTHVRDVKPKEKQQQTQQSQPPALQLVQLPTGIDKPHTTHYTVSVGGTVASPLPMTPPSVSPSGSILPPNYAGYHHHRRASGAYRFDTPRTPTEIF